MSDLFRVYKTFILWEEQIVAFETLNKLLSDRPVLAIYDPDTETELHTDTSMYCIGSVLLQKDCVDGKLHQGYNYSKKTTKNEEK